MKAVEKIRKEDLEALRRSIETYLPPIGPDDETLLGLDREGHLWRWDFWDGWQIVLNRWEEII